MQLTIGTDNPVAGDEQGKRIPATGIGHGAVGGRSSNGCGNLAIAPGFAQRNPTQFVPYLFLEGGAVQLANGRHRGLPSEKNIAYEFFHPAPTTACNGKGDALLIAHRRKAAVHYFPFAGSYNDVAPTGSDDKRLVFKGHAAV